MNSSLKTLVNANCIKWMYLVFFESVLSVSGYCLLYKAHCQRLVVSRGELLRVVPKKKGNSILLKNLFVMCRSKTETVSRVRKGPGKTGKSWNFIMAFSRTGKFWRKTTGPGKFWKSV